MKDKANRLHNRLNLLGNTMVSHILVHQKNGFSLRLQEKERNRFKEYAEMLASPEAIERATQFAGAGKRARIIRGAPVPAPL